MIAYPALGIVIVLTTCCLPCYRYCNCSNYMLPTLL